MPQAERPVPPLAAWIRAARPLAHGNIAPPILFGVALGASEGGTLDRWGLATALCFGVLDHLVIVFGNDLADEAADRHGAATLVSGGSRVLVDGLLSRSQLTLALRICAALLVALSLIATLRAPLMPVLAFSALLLLWLYSGDPIRLSYRGGGSFLQGLGVGAVLPLVGFTLQRPDELISPLLLAPSVLLGVAGNLLTALPDAEADRAAGKRTVASLRGVRVAAWLSLLLITFAVVLGGSIFAQTPTQAQWLTVVPLMFLVPSLFLLRTIEGDRGIRLRFVLLGLGAGTSALLCWSLAVL